MRSRLIAAVFILAAGLWTVSLVDAAAVVSDGESTTGPTLLAVMGEIETDMRELHTALWRDDLAAVATAAQAVADHPKVGAAERGRIAGILGDDIGAFAAADRRVHDLGVELAEAAEDGEWPDVMAALSELERGCMACHREFRDRIRAASP